MRERPILFSSPMVRAILSGTKTQSRRVVKPLQSTPKIAPLRMEPWLIDGEQETDNDGSPLWAGFHPDYPGEAKWFSCPYGKPGDRLWVRETWYCNAADEVIYRADYTSESLSFGAKGWKPSIHMPRWASRIALEVMSVHVERLHRIGELSAKAEGVEPSPVVSVARGESYLSYCEAFSDLWNEINGKRGYSWESNPWVWVIEFKKVV